MTRQISEDLFLELGELLNSNLDEVTILRTFCNRVLALFDAERVSILSMAPNGRDLTLAAWAGRYPENMAGVTVPVGEGVSGWVAATGESVLVPDVEKDTRFTGQFQDRYRTRSFISVPLKSRGRLLGVMNVTDTNMNEGFTEKNLRTLKVLALQVGMGMENLTLRDRSASLQGTTNLLVSALQELQGGSTDIETGLLPSTVRAMETALGPRSHMILIGEMGSNRAWVGTRDADSGMNMAVLDFRSGFSLYQTLATTTLQPPYQDNDRLVELGFAWDKVEELRLRLLRSLLPPRHDLFGLALSAVPDRAPEDVELLRVFQSVITQFAGLVLEGIFDRIQIQRLDHLKTELISTVSHELRTPLTSIQGFSDFLIRNDDIPERLQRYLHIINNESMRLNRLINNFLDLARLESGQLALTKEPFDPLEVVEKAVKLLNPQAEAAKAMVRLHAGRNLPILIADRDRIEQALVNLIGNAIKYGGRGVHVDINISDNDGHTVFEVADNGPGIPEEEISLVFNRFYRGLLDENMPEDKDSKGTGLGLSLTKEIVEQHGGAISVRSVPGERTTFRFSLPTQGLITPQRGITAWHPGDEEFTNELATRLAEGKTVGVLTLHINPGRGAEAGDDLYSVEALSEIEEVIVETLNSGGMQDNFIQSRPQGEFVILTYTSLVDGYASRLIEAFAYHFGQDYSLAIGAAVSDQGERPRPEKIMALSRQACQYVERTQKTGYLKNRRM
ncbi:MAG: GAF domain-containing sensor histidine kinase [bacterium]|nr:MAG: GAF domain-containing sensor histidine kinase [bacterium]